MHTRVCTRTHDSGDDAVVAIVLAATVGAWAAHEHGLSQVCTMELDRSAASLNETSRVVDRDRCSAAY
jgi:hypothetical protein